MYTDYGYILEKREEIIQGRIIFKEILYLVYAIN